MKIPKPISNKRKIAFYLGNACVLLGILSFVSAMFSSVIDFGDFANFDAKNRSMGLRAVGGMVLIFVGAVISNVGARGLSGSGVVLDPAKAREELEPYSRMTGGMIKDVLDEADITFGDKSKPVVMVRCQACQTLNPESAKYCQECGTKI